MRKIGILTFHRAANYGAVLQCYALQKKVEELGAESEVVDYICNKIERNYNPECRYTEKLYVRVYKWLFRVRTAEKRYKVFQEFINRYLKTSHQTYLKNNISTAEASYDKVIVGSDQVWNADITGNDSTFFLDFLEHDEKKYSYAASIGDVEKDSEEIQVIRRKVKAFEGLSIREQSILNALNIDNAETHIDPVFLLQECEWKAFAEKMVAERFVLVYSVRENWRLVKVANRYARDNGLKLVYVYSHFNLKEIPKVIRERFHSIARCETVSPTEFVGLIKDAECVFTNSFHGTAFSIIFHKKFYADIYSSEGKKNARLEELLEKFSLLNCKLKVDNSVCNNLEVDWERVEKIIKKERLKGENYIKSIIEN